MQLGPVIALVSGSTVDNALIDPEGELTKLVAAEKDNPRLIDELFLRILNRSATDAEIQTMLSILEQIPAEHEQLVAELKAYDKALAPKIAAQEKQRQAAIVKTKAAVEAHEMEIAPREAELDKQQKSKAERLAAELKAYEATLPEQLAKWEREKLGDKTVWTTLDPHELSSTFGAKLTKEKDRSIFVTEKHGVGSYNVVARTDLVGITAVRLEALADKRLPKNGPGRAPDGNFVVSEFEIKVAPESDPANATKLVLQNARADFSQQGFDVKTAIDGKVADVDNGWGISPQAGVNHTATFEFKEPIGDGSGSLLTLEFKQTVISTQHTLGRFRISVTTSPCPVDLEGVPPNVANLLLIAPYNRNAKQNRTLAGLFSHGWTKALISGKRR